MHIDKLCHDMCRYTKTVDTQLVWRFSEVPVSANFPLGVKAEYRAFSQDVVLVIVQDRDPNNPIGFKIQKRINRWQPACAAHNNNIAAGMYLCTDFPRAALQPAEFTPDSRAVLDSTVRAIHKCYGNAKDKVRIFAEWESFARCAPQTNSCADFVETRGLHIPMCEQLFPGLARPLPAPSGAAPAARSNVCLSASARFQSSTAPGFHETALSLDHVAWLNRGRDLPHIPPTVLVLHEQEDIDIALTRAAQQPGQPYEEMTIIQLRDIARRRGLVLLPTSRKRAQHEDLLRSHDAGTIATEVVAVGPAVQLTSVEQMRAYYKMNKALLKQKCAAQGVQLDGVTNKDGLVQALMATHTTTPTGATIA